MRQRAAGAWACQACSLELGVGVDCVGEKVCDGGRPRNAPSTCKRREIEGAWILDLHIHDDPYRLHEHSMMPGNAFVGVLHKYLRFFDVYC